MASHNMDLNDCSDPSDLTSSSSVTSDHTSDYAHAGAADSADFDGMQTHADVPQLIRQAVALYVSTPCVSKCKPAKMGINVCG
jgi:hypothetical protein